jgi:hypothetical protein
MKSTRGNIYTVVVLGGKQLLGEMEDCLVVTCTNMRSLEKISGIPYDRLTYLFTRKEKKVVYDIERDCIIFRSTSLYKGRQIGGIRNKNMVGLNR